MPKINMANIQSALGKVKDAAAPLQNKGHTENVPVDFIRLADRNIYNEGDSSETIKELADNIQACGLLHPITVNKIAPDNYQIISGERRYKAVTEYLHWKSVPCMVFDSLSPEAAQLKLCMANLAVREYSASQKYKFYLEVKALLEKMKASGEYKGGMQKGIAELLNVTERQVKKYYRLEKLPEEVQRDVLDGKISINKALETAQKSKDAPNDSTDADSILRTLLDQLNDSQREMIISGQVDITSLFQTNDSPSEKGEPVPLLDVSRNEDTMQSLPEKREPVPLYDTSRNEDTMQSSSKKGEPVPLLDASRNEDAMQSPVEKREPVSLSDDSRNDDTMHSSSEKGEPVPLSDDSRNEDTIHSPSEKGKPVPISDALRNEDTTHSPTEKGKPVPIKYDTNSKSIVDNTDSKTASDDSKSDMEKTKRSQDGSVLIYKNGQFIPNKIQILEEHEEYTIFKVFAVKL